MPIPLARTRRLKPKLRTSRASSRSNGSKKPSRQIPNSKTVSFVNPFDNTSNPPSFVSPTPKTEYISPTTTPPSSPPVLPSGVGKLQVNIPPKADYLSPSTRISISCASSDQTHKSLSDVYVPLVIPKPRRLSKEELSSPLLTGRYVLSTIKTQDGMSIVRRSFDVGRSTSVDKGHEMSEKVRLDIRMVEGK
ncbi:hypothetical protein L486_02736 [Kwoniella mangroviensis CBS 10435]|uniref:Uncharacterized protein n=1 Tax=Kwoniella mangroviensis CBS 10435 TaxID=1331196 RepID=A0A1B9IX13_9TREE|nr:uncharacterized protein I203_01427 [Kwoniella mangroviensis CBS 8507]OCF60063.1 hypothetical protein L486_02736 [Kwoniella mangroviensis CBS 10435]OCF69563.1 hypothetical protein I203_01427 [Kwoniella mangroviensis CBS 8507]OCF70981.1 hypothetical protein I204_08416 [Kwoniella mangroviensis CBS 8886]